MVKGRRDYSFATVLELMDQGTLKRLYAYGVDAEITMYTVPEGKKFYVLSACLNISHETAGYHDGWLGVYDGATKYRFIELYGPDSVEQMSESLAFTVFSMPAGWQVRLFADLHTRGVGCCVGVEVSA